MRSLSNLTRYPALTFLLLTALACGSSDTGAPPTSDVLEDTIEDTAPPEEVDTQEDEGDVEIPWDLADADLVEADPDVSNDVPKGFTDCPTLGISPYWEGTWEGLVTYNLVSDEPLQGLFLVNGTLSFEIKCLNQKLLVAGKLEGLAEAAGEVGTHPFAANIFGDFNYIERTIKANILNGEVRLFKVISIFFEGNFDGAVLKNGTFEGDWDGVQTGNDLNLEGDASGYGEWSAYPAPKPEDKDD